MLRSCWRAATGLRCLQWQTRSVSAAAQSSPKVTRRRRPKVEQEENESQIASPGRIRKRKEENKAEIPTGTSLNEAAPLRGKRRASRSQRIDQLRSKDVSDTPAPATTVKKRPRRRASSGTPRLLPDPSSKHHDLASFLAHAERAGLNPTTQVYKGTYYEYTVAEALRKLGFRLHRTGRSNDLGIDLLGTWALPNPLPDAVTVDGKRRRRKKSPAAEMHVLIQCKAVTPNPAMIRELAGAYAGAPAGWRRPNVLAFLVANKPATPGVRAAVQRSKLPMGALHVTTEGEVRQFVWNAAAATIGLEGVGVTVRYKESEGSDRKSSHDANEKGIPGRIALTWLGKVWSGHG